MINRVLLRIKVIQLLYSYLLTENHFTLESQSPNPTKEKRFAYSTYLNTLQLMANIAENITKSNSQPLLQNRFMEVVVNDEKIKAAITRANHGEKFDFDSLVDQLSDLIKDSAIYKNYLKNKDNEGNADVNVWKEIFQYIIWPNPQYNAVASRQPDFSLSGMDRMKEIMDATFTNFFSSHAYISDAVKTLRTSLDKARELYFRLLLLPIDITDFRAKQIDDNRHKMLPTEEDLNPNLKFVENEFIAELRNNTTLCEYADRNKINMFAQDPELVKTLFNAIAESDLYKEYMATPKTNKEEDYNFWRYALKDIIIPNTDFLEDLENKSVFWNDDIDIIGDFAVKTVRRFEEGLGQNAIYAMYKDREDAIFGEQLFSAVITNKQYYRSLINENINTEAWDAERLAFMDVVIIMTALAELLNFPSIPVKVTINEYIEMAKAYSSPKSGMFVNGLLGVIVNKLRKEGVLIKQD
jgi:N utilization substance protein B